MVSGDDFAALGAACDVSCYADADTQHVGVGDVHGLGVVCNWLREARFLTRMLALTSGWPTDEADPGAHMCL